MTWFFVLNLIMIGAAMALVPALSRPTVPLGVSIPSTRRDDPRVRAAVLRYQLGVAALGLLLVAITVVGLPPVVAALLPLVLAAGSTGWFWITRRGIIAAKRSEGWYDGMRVGVAAPARPGSERLVPVGLFAAAAVTLLATFAMGVAAYPGLPDPMPVHFDAQWRPDRWEAKSWFAALQVPVIITVVVTGMAAMVVPVLRSGARQLPDGTADRGRAEARERTRVQVLVLGAGALGVALIGAGVSATIWFLRGGPLSGMLLTTVLAVAAVTTVLPLVLGLRTRRQLDDDAIPGDTETPDDDRHWLGGLIYLNREDPAILVPQRTGFGSTVNLGHPVGIAVTAGILIVAAAAIGFALVSP